jgi:hypothetical protein
MRTKKIYPSINRGNIYLLLQYPRDYRAFGLLRIYHGEFVSPLHA